MQYLQWDEADVDANGVAPISGRVRSDKADAPPWPTQIIVADDFDASGLSIDIVNLTTVPSPPSPPEVPE